MNIGIRTVLLNSGKLIREIVHVYEGAVMVGDPTAYILIPRIGIVWVKPGESVSFVEAAPQYFSAGYCYECYADAGCVEVCTVG